MGSKFVYVRKAKLYVQLPVVCESCGRSQMSELIHREFEGSTIESLVRQIQSIDVGSSFPSGWGKYLTNGRVILKCPDCTT